MKRALVLMVGLLACRPRPATGWVDPPADGASVISPVTGARCSKTPESASAVYQEKTYYFCEPGELDRFVVNPSAYADR